MLDVGRVAVVIGIDDRVGPERRQDSPAEAVGRQGAVVGQVVDRRVGGRDHVDAEAVEQRAWAELGFGEAGGDVVVGRVGGLRRETLGDAEDLAEDVVEPHARRRAAEQVDVVGKRLPGSPRTGRRPTVERRHAEGLERNALAVEHPGQVVVRRDEECRRVLERLVGGEPPRVRVAVRADQRKVAHGLVELPGDRPRRRFGGQQPVRVEHERRHGGRR